MDNTTESLVQADINDVLDNMSARNATLTRELAISRADTKPSSLKSKAFQSIAAFSSR